MPDEKPAYILGLDLGTSSIGWAAVRLEDGQPAGILRTGVRIFEAGVDGSAADIERGREEAKGAKRRQMRQARRQIWRRAVRRRRILRVLQEAQLLPPGNLSTPEAIHEYLLSVDREIREKHATDLDRRTHHLLPYLLRARALDSPLSGLELGRAFYHLAQRRGFLSNRKTSRKAEDLGQVKEAIKHLEEDIASSHARTLGEYLFSLDPEIARVRARWTARAMYLSEFEAIWAEQAKHHPALTDDLRSRLHTAVFHQRKLKPQSHLIGECELLPGERRAPLACRVAQRFRLLQTVNNLRIGDADGREREATAEERGRLIAALEERGDLKFKDIRAALGLPKNLPLNLERGERKFLPGNRTDAALRTAFGDRWDDLSEAQRDLVVDEFLEFESEDELVAHARESWHLPDEGAESLRNVSLEEGYVSHSRKALERLVPALAAGESYTTARERLFQRSERGALEKLPPVKQAVPSLRNPAVLRTLSELRKIINALVVRYGKPEAIHVELGRDLRTSRDERKRISKQRQENENANRDAAREILAEVGIQNPSRADIEKWKLYRECGGVCPYTGLRMTPLSLFGPEPRFEVEHIWPLSRSLDDSFLNKTLCEVGENRNRKRNRTPAEAYAGTADWDAMLERVKRFNGPVARIKLGRFVAPEIPSDFTARHLQDTRYSSRLAMQFVGLLYGGTVDAAGTLRVGSRVGGLTAMLRAELGLNGFLGDGAQKNRGDHRHHAVDALVVALATQSQVAALHTAAEEPWKFRRRRFAPLATPWTGFDDSVRESLGALIVSHRPNRGLAGPLHAETIYGKLVRKEGTSEVRHIRRKVSDLTEKQIPNIADPAVRAAVERQLALQGKPPKEAFKNAADHPYLESRDGRRTPIHKVRVEESGSYRTVGKGARARSIASGAGTNHHTVVLEVRRMAKGAEEVTWTDQVVSRLDAQARLRENLPVVAREWSEGTRLVFSLHPGDTIELDGPLGSRGVYRVASIADRDIELRWHSDARTMVELKESKARFRTRGDDLRKRRARKVTVGVLGDVYPAND